MGAVEVLMLSKRRAAEYLGCSVDELERWVPPDRTLGDSNPATRRMRLWSGATLEQAKPHIGEWRERDRLESARQRQELEATLAERSARRKGMKKAGALRASRVCEILQCSKAELNRWAAEGRLPPDGELHVIFPRSMGVPAWLPARIEAAKEQIGGWREKDARSTRDKGFRIVR